MLLKRTIRDLLKAAVSLSAAGVLLGVSCGTEELQAVVAGLEAAANSLETGDSDNDLTFGEWLLSEIDD